MKDHRGGEKLSTANGPGVAPSLSCTCVLSRGSGALISGSRAMRVPRMEVTLRPFGFEEARFISHRLKFPIDGKRSFLDGFHRYVRGLSIPRAAVPSAGTGVLRRPPLLQLATPEIWR